MNTSHYQPSKNMCIWTKPKRNKNRKNIYTMKNFFLKKKKVRKTALVYKTLDLLRKYPVAGLI